MYLDHYSLREKPFTIVPDPDMFYQSAKHRLAMTHLEYGLHEGHGFILLTGDVGMGKTTLIKRLVRDLHDTEVAVIFNTNVNPLQLVRMVAEELELPVADSDDKASCLSALHEHILRRYAFRDLTQFT